MKFSVNLENLVDIKDIGEIVYDATKHSPSDFIKLAKEHDNIRKVYDVSDIIVKEKDILNIRSLPQAVENMVFKIDSLETAEIFKAHNLPFFCRLSGGAAADSLEKMICLCEKGLKDIYVLGQLGFCMKSAREIADRYKVNIRLVPNLASLSYFTFAHISEEQNLTAFWVRPEDLYMYNEYVDFIEVYHGGDAKNQKVLLEIYKDSKIWNGELSAIIVGLGDLDNRYLTSEFTKARINCEKKCMLCKCHSCFKHKSICKSKNLFEK